MPPPRDPPGGLFGTLEAWVNAQRQNVAANRARETTDTAARQGQITTTSSASRDFDLENYNERVAKGWPDYAFARDLVAQGYRELANGKFVGPRGDTYQRTNTPVPGVDPIYAKGYAATSGEMTQAAAITATRGSTLGPPPPGGAGPSGLNMMGSFFPDPFALQQAQAGGFMPGRLTDVGNFRMLPTSVGGGDARDRADYAMVTGLREYPGNIAGGPGRAGYTNLSRTAQYSAGAYARALREAADIPRNVRDAAILEAPGYDPRDPYAGGAPSFATSYYGHPATASFGTAGAEVRGGQYGGIGLDAGQILAAHGIAPSNDPAVNMATALAIAAGQGQYDPGRLPSVAAPTAPAMLGAPGEAEPDYGNDISTFKEGGEILPPLDPLVPTTTTTTDPLDPNKGQPPPVTVPPPPAPPLSPTMPTTYGPYDFTPQQQDYQQNLFGYRRQMAGLPRMQAYQLGPGEVPGVAAPTGYYYRNFDQADAARDYVTRQAFAPWELDYQKFLTDLAASRGTLEPELFPTRTYQPPSSPLPSPWAWNDWDMQFAGGGSLGYGRPMINEGPDGPGGRKSMVVPHPTALVDQVTGQTIGQMSEAGAELLTDTGSKFRIDPMMGAGGAGAVNTAGGVGATPLTSGTLPNVTPQEFSYLLKVAPDVATSLAQLDLAMMRTGSAPTAQMEMALGKAESISDPNARQRALVTYRNIVSQVNSTRMQPPPLSQPALPQDPVALAAAVKFGKMAA